MYLYLITIYFTRLSSHKSSRHRYDAVARYVVQASTREQAETQAWEHTQRKHVGAEQVGVGIVSEEILSGLVEMI